MLLGSNTGTYAGIDLSPWIAGSPVEVLASNFGQPAALLEKYPRQDVFIAPKLQQESMARRASRGERTPIEFFLAGIRDWEAGLRRRIGLQIQ